MYLHQVGHVSLYIYPVRCILLLLHIPYIHIFVVTMSGNDLLILWPAFNTVNLPRVNDYLLNIDALIGIFEPFYTCCHPKTATSS
jgi:hypothetical protein